MHASLFSRIGVARPSHARRFSLRENGRENGRGQTTFCQNQSDAAGAALSRADGEPAGKSALPVRRDGASTR
jgi:hypothetical protein